MLDLLRFLLVWSLVSGAVLATSQQPLKKAAADKVRDDVHWNNWRGPLGNGLAPDADPPIQWSEDKNILWKINLPGTGCSSPIVWKDRLYVTTAVPTGKSVGQPPEQGRAGGGGRGGRRGRRPQPLAAHEFVVLAIDRENGKVVWQKTVNKTLPHEGTHNTASLASNSPVTDGQHVYAFFGSRGLHCLDMAGTLKWSKDFGRMRTRNQFGEGSSPALHGDMLVINWDHEGDSWIAAFHKSNGKQIWKMKRDEVTTWCTPLITSVGSRPQVIVTASGASRGYDLESGEIIWSCKGMVANCIPTPIHVGGLVYLMSGHRGSSLQAIKVNGAKGDITGDRKHVIWEYGRGTSYTPSGLVYEARIYFLRRNDGVLSCLDAATGEPHYEGKRLGIRTVYSSLVGAAGRIYITSREGVTKVIKLGNQYEELASNSLDDTFDATAAIVGKKLYLRGRKHLYCVARKTGRNL